MGAYAAVISLKQTIECLLDPCQSRILLPNSEMEIVNEDLSFFQSFLETIESLRSSNAVEIESLERQARDAAKELEDAIDYHISDRFLSGSEISEDESLTSLLSQQRLQVKEELTSFADALKAEEEQSDSSASDHIVVPSTTTTDSDLAGKTKMVLGLDKELKALQNWILSKKPSRRRLSNLRKLNVMLVTGMAGIGKTTLVEQVYSDPLVINHFDHRLFLRIDHQYQLRDVLLLALDQLGLDPANMRQNETLGPYLRRCLAGGRYLIVLDNMWSTQVWDKLKLFFPDKDGSSRVILTSRLRDFIRRELIIGDHILDVPFLNDDQSWDLLRELVLISCDRQLEKIGRKIAKKCEGLPLAIIEIAKILNKTQKTVEEWEILAEQEDPLIITSDDDTPLSKALLLSYRMLPQYLKACFLYMGVFPKNYEITPRKLCRLWNSESLIPVDGGRQESYELIWRSVVLGDKGSSTGDGAFKTCRLHFTFRTLCVNEAKRERAFHIIKKYTSSLPDDLCNQQRLCVHNNVMLAIKQVEEWMGSVTGARSLLCLGPYQKYPIELHLPFRLLRVLDALAIRFYEFPHQVLELVHLRYLSITCDEDLPHSISRLSNLEDLIIHRYYIIKISNAPVYLPKEIWKLRKLKHLECIGFDLPDPPPDDSVIMESLQRLSGVSARSFTVAILDKLPNLNKIGIQIESWPNSSSSVETFSFPGDVTYFDSSLGSFTCVVANPCLGHQIGSFIPALPIHLRKLTLSGCGFSWEYMKYICRLPVLRILKLRHCAFRGHEWKMFEERLPKLVYLLLEDLDIQHWESDYRHSESDYHRSPSLRNLPRLEHLIIRHCYKLREIPPGIGCVRSLRIIEVDSCSLSAGISARKILQDQRGDRLQVVVHSSADDKKRKP